MAEARDNEGRIIRTGPYPELTWPGVLVGWFLGALIAISIGFAALKLGFSIEGSELAAILGFGILRGILRRKSIVENNINQTAASAVNGASAGMMFSVPAIFILGTQMKGEVDPNMLNPVLMIFACIAGAFLGIAFIIPLRKQMIDYERLAYPGGVAVATILKSPGAGVRKALFLLGGAGISMVAHLVVVLTHTHVWPLGGQIGLPGYLNVTFYLSLMTVGVAYIAGRGGIYFVIGGFLCYWILSPIMDIANIMPVAAGQLRGAVFLPVGIGMLIGGALTGIALALPLIISAVRSMQQAAKMKASIAQDEMPVKLLYVAIFGAAILLFVLAITATKEIGIIRGGAMAILGTIWIWVAGVVLSECIGRTNWSPLSGMTLIAVTILVIIASGVGTGPAIVTSIVVGGAACVAMAQATDLMMDLKTGYLVGATPKKQQLAQFAGAWLGPIVVMALILLLHNAYDFGSEKGQEELPAPQANALAAMVKGILGGDIPLTKYIAGAGLGALLSASGVGGLGILVGLGFYMPFFIVLTYTIGAIIRVVSDWRLGKRFADDVGIPIAAGFIVGEALVGVGDALVRVFSAM
jgi:putative OPT family oligopeptide transporter